MKMVFHAMLLVCALTFASIPVAAQHWQGTIGHSWDAPCDGKAYQAGEQFGASWCEKAGHSCVHADCDVCTGPKSPCRLTPFAVARPAAVAHPAHAAPVAAAHHRGSIAASWCEECRHEHCSPGHLYTKNCRMIDELQYSYCVSPNYVASLRVKNDNCYGSCRGYGAGTCQLCGASAGADKHRTLASLNGELAGLFEKCRPVN